MTNYGNGGPPPVARGEQNPRIRVGTTSVRNSASDAIELARYAGLTLDPWQQLALREALGERADGTWSTFELAIIVARQNGKGSIIEARELAGLFLFNEGLISHTSHEFKTTQEAFRRILGLITDTDSLRKQVKRVRTSHGEEGIELLNGQRLRFMARSRSSGRGFSGDLTILDEAQILGDEALAALYPTMSARPNPQVWFTGSAGSPESTVLGRLRRRAMAKLLDPAKDPRLSYLEWSADLCHEGCPVTCDQHMDPDDPETWRKANPALGYRIYPEFIASEREALSRDMFARERLSVGTYPTDGDEGWSVIPKDSWSKLRDPRSRTTEPIALGVDITPERSHGALAVAGLRPATVFPPYGMHVEVIDHRPRTEWMADRIVQIVNRWHPCAVVIDPRAPAGSLIAELEAAGVEVVSPSGRDVGQAFGWFVDLVQNRRLRHLDQPHLNAALAGAQAKQLGEAQTWDRRRTTTDISPLVATTLAAWGYNTRAHLLKSYDVMQSVV